jgi:hypothetical protein
MVITFALQWQVRVKRPTQPLSQPAPGYPDGHPDKLLDEEKELDYLKAKVDTGADFIVTQLFYDVDGFLTWLRKVRQKGPRSFCFSCTYLNAT